MSATRRWPGKAALTIAVAIASWLGSAPQARALVVDTFTPFQEGEANPNQNLVNTTAPEGDRGWSNLLSNRGGVYLGDHWVLSARHVDGDGGSVVIGGETFEQIPGTLTRLSNANGSLSDLILWRVGVNSQGQSPEDINPQLRDNLRLDESTGKLALPIANRLPGFGENLTLFGRGRTRSLSSTTQVNSQGTVTGQNTFFDSSGAVTSDADNARYAGHLLGGVPNVAQWGENRRFGGVITIQGGIIAPTTGFRTRFDENGLENEAQASGGDSGGPVFWQDGDDWVLAGVLHGVFFPTGAPANDNLLGAYGAQTGISDLSQAAYTNQLNALRAQVEYSVLGDIDLDGVVDASFSGGVASGDLGILVSNWQREFDTANIQSWIAGDLNQDAVVDLTDFALLRSASGGRVSLTQLQTALLAVSVPEPSTLVLLAGALGALGRRRR